MFFPLSLEKTCVPTNWCIPESVQPSLCFFWSASLPCTTRRRLPWFYTHVSAPRLWNIQSKGPPCSKSWFGSYWWAIVCITAPCSITNGWATCFRHMILHSEHWNQQRWTAVSRSVAQLQGESRRISPQPPDCIITGFWFWSDLLVPLATKQSCMTMVDSCTCDQPASSAQGRRRQKKQTECRMQKKKTEEEGWHVVIQSTHTCLYWGWGVYSP